MDDELALRKRSRAGGSCTCHRPDSVGKEVVLCREGSGATRLAIVGCHTAECGGKALCHADVGALTRGRGNASSCRS